MISSVNSTSLVGYKLSAVNSTGDKSIEISDNGLVIGKNLNSTPTYVTLNSDGITKDGVTTDWDAVGGGGSSGDITTINSKLTAVATAPDSTTFKVNKKILVDNGSSNTGSVGINSDGNFEVNSTGDIVLAPTGNVLLNKSNIRLGSNAGLTSQGTNCIAIGDGAGQTNQGSNSIAIGYRAGYSSQAANSIVLNASGSAINSTNNGFFVSPVRSITSPDYLAGYTLGKEIVQGPAFVAGSVSIIYLSSSDSTMVVEPTYDTQSVLYTQINRTYTYFATIVLTSKGNTPNTLRIKGLPGGKSARKCIGMLSCSPMIPNCIGLRSYADTTSSLLRIQKRVDAVSDWTDLTITDITDTTEFVINITVYI